MATKQSSVTDGLLDGVKRVNLKQVRGDVREEGRPYVVGYVAGFVVKTLLVVFGAMVGFNVPV